MIMNTVVRGVGAKHLPLVSLRVLRGNCDVDGKVGLRSNALPLRWGLVVAGDWGKTG